MRIDINLFNKRYSDANEDLDIEFVNIFSNEILHIFDKSSIWNTINIIRSSPGAGKTTLLKLFTPRILLHISRNRTINDANRELYKLLSELKAFDADSISVYGSLIPFTKEYYTIELLQNVSDSLKARLFFAFLNSRIVLSLINSICAVHDIDIMEDLNRISFEFDEHPNRSSYKFPIKGSGSDLIQWAQKIEEKISEVLDSILPIDDDGLIGHNDLFVLSVLDSKRIKVDDKPLKGISLMMFDDIHNLSRNQRESLIEDVIRKRPRLKVWISERLQSLSIEEVFDKERTFSNGQTYGREINIIEIEKYFHQPKKFEKFCRSVAEKRVQVASNDEISHFEHCIAETPNQRESLKLNSYLEELSERIKAEYGHLDKFLKWVEFTNDSKLSAIDKIIQWRALEILIIRNKNRQVSMWSPDPLSEEEFENQEGSDVKNAARLFASLENEAMPYYFGFQFITRVGSRNIEQFIELAGMLFEDIITQRVYSNIKRTALTEVSITRQHKIVKRYASKKWLDFKDKVRGFDKIRIFITSMVSFCEDQTHRPSAPISPGVNGIAITMGTQFSDRERLRMAISDKEKTNPLRELASLIATCISYNILEERLNYERKGKKWMQLYLNRAICANNDLPLSYGGYKEVKIDTLLKWMSPKYKPNQTLWQ